MTSSGRWRSSSRSSDRLQEDCVSTLGPDLSFLRDHLLEPYGLKSFARDLALKPNLFEDPSRATFIKGISKAPAAAALDADVVTSLPHSCDFSELLWKYHIIQPPSEGDPLTLRRAQRDSESKAAINSVLVDIQSGRASI